MPRRLCVVCGVLSSRNYCPAHRGQRNGSTREWRKVRAATLARDRGRCHYCGAQATTVDHVYPVAAGGSSHPENLVAACATCNGRKGATIPGGPTKDADATPLGHCAGAHGPAHVPHRSWGA